MNARARPTCSRFAVRVWSCVCGLMLLFSKGASAAAVATHSKPGGERSIVLIRVEGDAQVAHRLRAELIALGWVVHEIAPDRPAPPAPAIGDVAKNFGALAVMRANPAAEEVELWVAHRPSTSVVHDSVGAPAVDVLAVLAVEALRAKLLRLGVVGIDAPETSIPALPPEAPRPLIWLGAAPALLLSPGGVGFTPQALLALRFDMSPRWSASLWSALPLRRTELDLTGVQRPAPGTWVDASVGLYGARLSYRVAERDAWDASVGLGAALAAVQLEAHAPPPWRGTSEQLFAAGPVLAGELSYQALPGLKLTGQFMLGSMFPRSVLEFEEYPVATWGRPFATVGLGIDVALPGVHR